MLELFVDQALCQINSLISWVTPKTNLLPAVARDIIMLSVSGEPVLTSKSLYNFTSSTYCPSSSCLSVCIHTAEG